MPGSIFVRFGKLVNLQDLQGPSLISECFDAVVADLLSYLHVNITDEMVTQVIAHIHLFNFSIFVFHLDENILEKVVVVRLHFHVGYGVNGCA